MSFRLRPHRKRKTILFSTVLLVSSNFKKKKNSNELTRLCHQTNKIPHEANLSAKTVKIFQPLFLSSTRCKKITKIVSISAFAKSAKLKYYIFRFTLVIYISTSLLLKRANRLFSDATFQTIGQKDQQ